MLALFIAENYKAQRGSGGLTFAKKKKLQDSLWIVQKLQNLLGGTDT
jgi:hypothetical protein